MVKVTVARGARGVASITVEGHAGYKARGKDIVCAAASALAYAAAGALVEVAGLAQCHVERDGFFAVSVPEELGWEARRTAETIMRTACVGFRLIAAEYPKHLKLEYGGDSYDENQSTIIRA